MALVHSFLLLSALQLLIIGAAPTWPNYVNDELEDIMFLNTGYRSRQFSKEVTPCSHSSQGPGRIAAAEWLRTTFHDMATYNVYSQAGGIDASLAYELNDGENVGAAFNTTLTTYEPFMGVQASMSDLIALGTYTAVRSCGGLPIPIRPGRVDAKIKGALGVPQPQNAISTFVQQFARMGFSQQEMIQSTACGHSIGGVHAANFPLIVAPGTAPNDFATMDTTPSTFDNKIITEYLSNTTTDPLVNGLSVRYSRNSDLVVFRVDNNVTMKALADPAAFQSTCQKIFQKMIETIPGGVSLAANPIVPYEAKPYGLQLSLNDASAATATFSGDIRIRTTSRSPVGVRLIYKDGKGGNSCNNDCTIYATSTGTASGFDDTFSFFGFSANISMSTSISSFTVAITNADGSTESLDNNGAGFPVQDTMLFQQAQSCTASSSGMTVTAAVRNTTNAVPVLNIIGRAYKAGIIVPTFNTTSLPMTPGQSVGGFTLYTATVPLNTSQAATARFNLTLPSSTAAVAYQAFSGLASSCAALASAASTPASTPYTSLGCVTDPVNPRALKDTFYYDSTSMTTASCSAFCSTYAFFGTEYSGECYCGNALSSQSTNASLSDCSMPCSGDSTQICGGPGRLSFYQNPQYVAPSTPSFSRYKYQGCFTDSASDRSLPTVRNNDNALTIQSCADFCLQGNYTYMGAEYHSECYCSNTLGANAILSPDTDCSTVCSGNSSQACGGPDRLSVYELPTTGGSKRRSLDEATQKVKEHLLRHSHGHRKVRRLFDEVVKDASN